MSVHATAWAKRQRLGDPTQKHVLLAVADYADEYGVSWPSQERLAFDTELSDRTIRGCLKLMESRRILHRTKRPRRADGTPQSDTPGDERDAVGRRLISGQIKVAVNVGTLTTGVDWPEVSCISLVRPTKSEMLFVQIVGRGLRIAAGKTDCIVLDHSDTTMRLGFPGDIHHGELDDGKPRTSADKAREHKTPLPKECPKCTALKPAGVHKCPNCGFAPERQSTIEERDGELFALNTRGKGRAEPTPHTKQEFWSMLVWKHDLVRNKDKNGKPWKRAIACYRARFGVWPRYLDDRPILPDEAFERYNTARNITYRKRQEKLQRGDRPHAS